MVRKAQTLNAEGARRMMGDMPLLSADQVHRSSRLGPRVTCLWLLRVNRAGSTPCRRMSALGLMESYVEMQGRSDVILVLPHILKFLVTFLQVAAGAVLLIQQPDVGPALLMLQNGGVMEWPSKRHIDLPAVQAKL